MANARSGGIHEALRAAGLNSGPRRLLFGLATVILLCVLCAPLFVDNIDHGAPKATAGVIDLSGRGPLNTPVELSGQWRLVWRSGAPGPSGGAQSLSVVPGSWAEKQAAAPANAARLPALGAASYRLTLKGLRPGRYLLYVPTIHAASRVSANGRVLSEMGVAGASEAETRSTVRSHDVVVDTDGGPLELALDVSAYHEISSGIESAPLFGLAQPMNRWITLHWLRSLLLITSSLILGCYGLVVFLFRRREVGWLYFSIAGLALAPVLAVFAHDNLMLVLLPDMPLITMRLWEYLTVCVALWAVIAYTSKLFPDETSRRLYWGAQGIVILDFAAYVAAAAIDGTMGLSEVSHWSLWVRIGGMVYVIATVLAATIRRRDGAAIYLVGVTFFFSSMMYTDLTVNGFVPRMGLSLDLMPLGMLVMLFCQLVIMAERWVFAIDAAEATSGELRQLLDVNVAIASEIHLEALLRRIVQVTSQIIRADRSSLFLYDEKTDELWSMVAEGVESRQIRFPSTAGLAGDSFTRQAPINVTDAYSDSRFNQQVDRDTGYTTRAVLTAPVTTRDGRRLGVMQAFNRLDGEPFSETDVARLTAFGAQAAVAIENATLFAEVATERNYNESILRSMSSGVVTLDREQQFAKLNAAACAILGVDQDAAGDPETQRRLAEYNPWLVPEIGEVAATGRPKSLFDADLKTFSGAVISANISIVPLMTEEGQAGLLIIIDDITEGKRVQSAMRRFMTQKVVDQIMGREDELLFGAACEASVLFADIRNFTTLAEQLNPRDTVDMLNDIFTELFEAVAANDGVLDKFIGDAIMAVYGAPLMSDRDTANSVDSAVTMIGMIAGINEKARARGLPEIRLGVGIASGEVVAGAIGSPKRMDYTVIGDPVNLASRLEGITKLYKVGIVVCEDTAKAVEGLQALRELDTIRVRGRSRPARIFQVMTEAERLPDAALAAYAKGLASLAVGEWSEAIAGFEACLILAPHDGPAGVMLERARILAEAPPEEGWDGVWDPAKAA
ncbi:MAG: adenylate/guanylate cyclase domain-containing protein [Phenylobacterium sp.]